MVRVRQNFDNSHVEDVPAELRRQLASEKFEGLIRPGMSIAITCGSRGITNYPEVLRELASICKEAGAHPFVIPRWAAMPARPRRDRSGCANRWE